jgi:hypothetical protein
MPIWSPAGLVLVLVALVATQQARAQQLTRGQRALRGAPTRAHACRLNATPPLSGHATQGDTNCTTLSLIPTATGNAVRSLYYAQTTVRSQGSSTTVSRSDNIHILTPRLLSLVRRWRS